MANKNISIAEALQRVSKTVQEYINKNTPHIVSEDVILTIPASSIVKADYETAKSNNEPYYVKITGTATEEFNENNLYSVKYDGKEYECSHGFDGSYTVNTDTMRIGITLEDAIRPASVDDEISAQSVTVATPPFCYIGLIDTTNITDIQLISKKVQRLDNMYLKRDLKVGNSLTLGNRTGNIGKYSLASGNNVEASGLYSHAEGSSTTASGHDSHAEGDGTKATTYGAHAEGCDSEASGMYSHAEGYFTKASSDFQHVQGQYNIEDTEGKYAHIVGNGANDKTTNWKEVRSNAHTLDWKGNAWFAGDVQASNIPHEVSKENILTIPASSIVKADYETAKSNNEPYFVKINDTVAEEFNENNLYSVKFNGKEYDCSYQYGSYDVSTDSMSIEIKIADIFDDDSSRSITHTPTPPYCQIGLIDTSNITDIQLISRKVQRLDNMYLKRDLEVANSLTIGNRIGDIGEYSLASGGNVEASGDYSHAEGSDTTASGGYAHAEGCITKATNWGTHAEGCRSEASGFYSHAEGYDTKASSKHQHVQGRYNIEDAKDKYAHIVGNGTDDNKRSNAHTLDWKGNAWFAGEVQANNVPHVVGKEDIFTIPASSIVKADYESNKSRDWPYYIQITGTLPVINSDDLYLVKYNNVEYDASAIGSMIRTDCQDCLISFDFGNADSLSENEIEDRVMRVPDPPYCAIREIDINNITDIVLIRIKVQKLDNKFLKSDLEIKNSISMNRNGATGILSTALGDAVEASGDSSHAEGSITTASGDNSHAEGSETTASGHNSHAEGYNNTASGYNSHAEGYNNTASGDNSHAEGNYTTASGDSSHAEGESTIASGENQHVQGRYNIEDTEGKYAHIVGNGAYDSSTNWEEVRSNAHTLDWKGNAWFAGEVQANNIPHVISTDTVLTVPASSIVKADYENAIANGNPYYISITGAAPTINNDDLYIIRYNNIEYEAMNHFYAPGLMVNDPNCDIALVFGGFDGMSTNESTVSDTDDRLMALPDPPYCEINKLDINNITNIEVIQIKIQKLDNKFLESDLKIKNSISMGRKGVTGISSTALGIDVEASGKSSHAEGMHTTASANATHAEGSSTTASAYASHAEGDSTTASGQYSHAEGNSTTASGEASHAEGYKTTASGDNSHVEGYHTTASGKNQHVQGKYNIKDTENKYAHIVGNGARDSSTDWKEVRSNAHTLDWNGNAWFAGKLSQEGTPTEDKDLVTKKYVDEHSANIADGFIMNDQVNGNKYLIQMRDGVLTSIQVPSSISVDPSSGGVTAIEGEAIDLNSITFMANYSDGTSSQITDTENISYTPSTLTTNVTKVTFVYNIGGIKLTYDMPIKVTTFNPAVDLQDFEYTTNGDGTYTLTGWKGTHNGVASTELIIPNSKKIIL